MKIILAPMHQYTDFPMRTLLWKIGGIDAMVSEFIRITHTVHSSKIWHQKVPELSNPEIPIAVQLLGSEAQIMAENAAVAASMGAKHIDVNLGCPAAGVNQHGGGAILLQHPDKIEKIMRTIRHKLPDDVRLTAKMRLGYHNTFQAEDCIRAIENGGASQVVVHARTKVEAYRPPAHWEWFARLQNLIGIPLIANGDIFSPDDVIRLKAQFDAPGIMIGRGLLRNPFLARAIKAMPYDENITQQLFDFINLCLNFAGEPYALARLKQWLALLAQSFALAHNLLPLIRPIEHIDEARAIMRDFSSTPGASSP